MATLFIAMTSLAANESIYDAGLGVWRDDTNKEVKISDFKGSKVVMAMVYTSCPMACPLMMKKLLKVQERLIKQSVQAEFVVVSFDAKFDTPAKLAAFRKKYQVPDTKWHLLVGSEKDTRFLSNLLEIRFSRNPKDQTISHDNKFVLLDEAGKIVKSIEGLSIAADEKYY